MAVQQRIYSTDVDSNRKEEYGAHNLTVLNAGLPSANENFEATKQQFALRMSLKHSIFTAITHPDTNWSNLWPIITCFHSKRRIFWEILQISWHSSLMVKCQIKNFPFSCVCVRKIFQYDQMTKLLARENKYQRGNQIGAMKNSIHFKPK